MTRFPTHVPGDLHPPPTFTHIVSRCIVFSILSSLIDVDAVKLDSLGEMQVV